MIAAAFFGAAAARYVVLDLCVVVVVWVFAYGKEEGIYVSSILTRPCCFYRPFKCIAIRTMKPSIPMSAAPSMGFRRRRLSLSSSRVVRIKKESMEHMMFVKRKMKQEKLFRASLLTWYFTIVL